MVCGVGEMDGLAVNGGSVAATVAGGSFGSAGTVAVELLHEVISRMSKSPTFVFRGPDLFIDFWTIFA